MQSVIHRAGLRLRRIAPLLCNLLKKDKGLTWIHPDITNISRNQLGTGTVFIGSPGSGKTVVALPYALELQKTGRKMMMLDVKGEAYEKLGMSFVGPWLLGSMIIDIGNDIRTQSESQLLADILVPVPDSGKDKVWAASANSVVASNIYKLAQDKPGKWTWSDLADKADESIEQWLSTMKDNSASQAKILEGAGETSASVAFNVTANLKRLRQVADMFEEARKFGGKMFSIRDWVYNKDYHIKQVILRQDDKFAPVMGFVIAFLIEYICRTLSNLPNNANDPKTIMLDEFAQVQKIESLLKLVETGRSKAHDIFLLTQDWNQVVRAYGAEFARILLSNISVKIIGRIGGGLGSGSIQSEIASMLGYRDVSILNVSQSTGGSSLSNAPSVSLSYQEKNMQLVLPGELEDLGPCDDIPNPKKNPPKGQETVPTNIKAIVKPMSGDVFFLKWPIKTFKDVKKAPRELPSHHICCELVRSYMRRADGSPEERLKLARQDDGLKMTEYELIALLYSDGHIDKKSWQTAKKDKAALQRLFDDFSSLSAAPTQRHASQPQSHPAITHQDNFEQELFDSLGLDSTEPTGPDFRFEGLQEEHKQEPHEDAEEKLDDGAQLLSAIESMSGIGHEASHAMHTIEHVTEALELFERHQSPAPILTPTPPENEPLTRLQKLQARATANKKKLSQKQE